MEINPDDEIIKAIDGWLKDDAIRIRRLTSIPEEIKEQVIKELQLARVTGVVSSDLVKKLQIIGNIWKKKDN